MKTIFLSFYDSVLSVFEIENKICSILRVKQLHILCTACILINSFSVIAQADVGGLPESPPNIISLGCGMNFSSGNGSDANLGKNGYLFQMNYFRSLWVTENVSLGFNFSGDYSISNVRTDGLQKYKPLQINGSSAPETNYNNNQKLSDPALRIGLGPQLNLHFGKKIMISQMLNVAYVNQTIEGRTVTQSSLIREQPFTKDIYTQQERKVSGVGFIPKLRFHYLFGNLGVWLEGNYGINPKFTFENNVFLPSGAALTSDGTVPDKTYDFKEIDAGSYYTTTKTVVNNQVGVLAGISYAFGVSKKNTSNTSGRQQGQDFNTTRNNRERGQFATNPSGGDSANPANTANRQQAQDFNTVRSNRERGQFATNPSGGDSANPANTANRQQAQDFNTVRSNRDNRFATNPSSGDSANPANTANRQQAQDFNTVRSNRDNRFATNPSGGDSANPANTANKQQAQDFNTTRSNRERGQLATNPNTTDQNNKDNCSALRDENNEKKETINIITLEPESFSLISNNVKKSGKDYSAQDIKNPPTEGYNPWEMEETLESPLLIPLTSNQEEISLAEPKSKKNNPTYDESGNSGINPLYEGKAFRVNPGGSVVSTVFHSMLYSNEGIFTTNEKGQKAMAIVPVKFLLKVDKKETTKSLITDKKAQSDSFSETLSTGLPSDNDLKKLLKNSNGSTNNRKTDENVDDAVVILSDYIVKKGMGTYLVRGVISVDGVQHPVIVHHKTKHETAKNSVSNIR